MFFVLLFLRYPITLDSRNASQSGHHFLSFSSCRSSVLRWFTACPARREVHNSSLLDLLLGYLVRISVSRFWEKISGQAHSTCYVVREVLEKDPALVKHALGTALQILLGRSVGRPERVGHASSRRTASRVPEAA